GRAPEGLGVLRGGREGDVEATRLHPLPAGRALLDLEDDDLLEVRAAPAAPIVRVADHDDLIAGRHALDHVGTGRGGGRLEVAVRLILRLLLHVRVHDAGAVLRGEQQVEPRYGGAEIYDDSARILHHDLLVGVGDVVRERRAGAEVRRDGAGV